MSSEIFFSVVVGLVGLERLAELRVAKRNATWSMQRGGRVSGASHYPPMVFLHTALLVGALAEVWIARPQFYVGLAIAMGLLLIASQALRWWCIRTLGHQWNTKIIIVPGMSAVRSGPYRFFTHPNYVAVVVEGFALPLMHTAWITATAFTILNAILLRVRIRAENAALRELSADHQI